MARKICRIEEGVGPAIGGELGFDRGKRRSIAREPQCQCFISLQRFGDHFRKADRVEQAGRNPPREGAPGSGDEGNPRP